MRGCMVSHDIFLYFRLVYIGDLDGVLDSLLSDDGQEDGATTFIIVPLAKFLVSFVDILFVASRIKM